MHLITLEGTSDTMDGTGLIPELLEARLKLLPSGWVARVPFFKGIDPIDYIPALKAIRAAGGATMLQPVDSEWMGKLSVSQFRDQVEEVITKCAPYTDIVEYANEINGQRENSWTGGNEFEKAMAGLAVCTKHLVHRAVTFYFDVDDPSWMFDWILSHQGLTGEFALVSYYPSSVKSLDSDVIPKLAELMRAGAYGVGEYGAENFNSQRPITAPDIDLLVKKMETRTLYLRDDIGGGGYWDFYSDVVATTDDTLLNIFQNTWKKT